MITRGKVSWCSFRIDTERVFFSGSPFSYCTFVRDNIGCLIFKMLKLYTWSVNRCFPTFLWSRYVPPPAHGSLKNRRVDFYCFSVRCICLPRKRDTETKGAVLEMDPENNMHNYQEDGHRRANCPILTHGSRSGKYHHTEDTHVYQHGKKASLR